MTPATVQARRHIADAEQMHALGRQLAAELQAGDLVILSGELGAGKTTLTRGIGEGLGVRGPITSPTFVIARLHPSMVGGPGLLHVDAYRLDSGAELEDLDLDAELADCVTVVEWGEGLAESLAARRLEIRITRALGQPGDLGISPAESTIGGTDPKITGEGRVVEFTGVGDRWHGVGPFAAG